MESNGNEVIDILFKMYHDTLINYCRRKGYSEYDAKEFVDETFLRLIKNIDKVKDRHLKEQRSWLYSTVENVISEHIYKNRYMNKNGLDTFENTLPDHDNYSNIIDKDTYAKIIKDIYSRLEDDDIEFLDNYTQGRISYAQIAAAENKNYNTVKSQVYRKIVSIRKIAEDVLKKQNIEVSTFTSKKKTHSKNSK